MLSIINEILQTLTSLSEKGGKGFDCSEKSMSILSSWKRPVPIPQEHVPKSSLQSVQEETETIFLPASNAPKQPEISAQNSEDPLGSILRDIGDCKRCKLANTRTNIVFGEGSPSARLMFVGEAPGFDEDCQGRPFVGRAGQLLTKIIQAMNMTREEVYICNVIKCRPPENRNPEKDEIMTCSQFLNRQISVIKPRFICALGTFSAQTLLKTNEPISKLRGNFFDYSGIRLMPTFHPSYLLRNPDKKREVWNDMQLIMQEMDKA